jgi:hypothetical protein
MFLNMHLIAHSQVRSRVCSHAHLTVPSQVPSIAHSQAHLTVRFQVRSQEVLFSAGYQARLDAETG